MQTLFAHSDRKVTERYLHGNKTQKLGKIAQEIRLFPEEKEIFPKSSQTDLEEMAAEDGVC